MKTYAEVNGRKTFDWWAEIKKRKKTGGTTIRLSNRASNWVTCACGTLCAVIPRHEDDDEDEIEDGAPRDDILSDYGTRFYEAVTHSDWEKAEECLVLIEHRSSQIIDKIEREALNTLKLLGWSKPTRG